MISEEKGGKERNIKRVLKMVRKWRKKTESQP